MPQSKPRDPNDILKELKPNNDADPNKEYFEKITTTHYEDKIEETKVKDKKIGSYKVLEKIESQAKKLEYEVNNEVYKEMRNTISGVSTKEEAKQLRRLVRSYGIFDKNSLKYNTTCYRFPKGDPYRFIDGVKEYIFITKVDLPMLAEGGDGLSREMNFYPYFLDLWNSGYINPVFANLCFTSLSPSVKNFADGSTEYKYPFMRILSNRKTSNLDIPDINVEELEGPVNLYGSKIIYSKSSMLSDENIDFSLEFEDTKYLEIYHLFKAYDLYRQGKWLGVFGPGVHALDYATQYLNKRSLYGKYISYITNKILYDHMSVYRFLVASDGHTILHGLKITGCFPKSISRSSLSELDEKGGLKITISFKVSGWLDEDMVEIARDFNTIIYNYVGNNSFLTDNIAEPLYDEFIDRVSQESVDYPFIRKSLYPNDDGFTMYNLLWGNLPNKNHVDGITDSEIRHEEELAAAIMKKMEEEKNKKSN